MNNDIDFRYYNERKRKIEQDCISAWLPKEDNYMLSTGRNDKNRQPIYEGDIVIFPDKPTDNNSYVVRYDLDLCGFSPFCTCGADCCREYIPEECVIIGNIYDGITEEIEYIENLE